VRFVLNRKKREINVTWRLRRKYRVLDDCARLREVIETFPDDRHFILRSYDAETLPE